MHRVITPLHGVIKETEKLKLVGEWLQPNGRGKEGNKNRVKKMELIYKRVQHI